MLNNGVVGSSRRFWRVAWPWFVLALMVFPAVWHVVYFPNERDSEFPRVDRPTFNRMPPAAYRLAEPGDTLDRVAIYLSAAGLALSLIGLVRSRRGTRSLWPAALALSAAGLWHASTPGPTFDGWHGLGFRAVFDANTPTWERVSIALGAIVATYIVVSNVVIWSRSDKASRQNPLAGNRLLLLFAGLMVMARQFEIPGIEPVGYWPRWAQIWGFLAFDLALLRTVVAQGLPRFRMRLVWIGTAGAVWLGLVAFGITMTWYHRPLDRFREVARDVLYISAMPTYEGLKVAHDRHHFKTIINIFPEDTFQRSDVLPEEHRFVREYGVRYVEASARDNQSDPFLDMCLEIVRDPANQPVLLHCHGSMDRSPGWMGVYRFIVQHRPLDEIMKEIERHRGYRPKASITLLFNRVLECRAPEQYKKDPTAALLRKYANGIKLINYPRSEASALSRKGEPPTRP